MPLNASCLGKVAQFPFCKILNGALLPGSSALPQTPDYHPSAQNPVVSALSRTRLQQFGTNSACLSVLSNITLPQKPFSFQKPFLQCHCPEIQESVCVGWGGGGGVYAKFSHSCLNNVICVGVDSTFELYVKLRRFIFFDEHVFCYVCVVQCFELWDRHFTNVHYYSCKRCCSFPCHQLHHTDEV